MERLCNVVEIFSIKAANRYSSISCHVNCILVSKLFNHFFVEPCESKHSDLIDDVLPGVLATLIKKLAV